MKSLINPSESKVSYGNIFQQYVCPIKHSTTQKHGSIEFSKINNDNNNDVVAVVVHTR